jgi:hypothetical protein
MMGVSTLLMLRSEAIARRNKGVLSNALWPRFSKHDPEGAAPFVCFEPPFETRLWRSSGRGPREACELCERPRVDMRSREAG